MLGHFPTVARLLVAVRENVAAIRDNSAARPPGGGQLPLCAVVGNLFYAASAVVAGKPVTIMVFGKPDPLQVLMYDSACSPLFTGQL